MKNRRAGPCLFASVSAVPGRRCRSGTASASSPMPVLVLAGENDERFASLAQTDRRRRSATTRQSALLPGAGHACHLEKPVETAEIIESFWSGAGKRSVP